MKQLLLMTLGGLLFWGALFACILFGQLLAGG
jgi:hypothetical protein